MHQPLLIASAVFASAALAATGTPLSPSSSPPAPTPAAEISALHARPSLVSEHAALIPGQTQYLGVRFRIDDGWHIYWDGQNLAGYPPNFAWHVEGAEGLEIDPVVFPAPERYKQPVLRGVEHTYHDEILFLVPVSVPENLEPGSSVTITGEVDWLVCEATCIPEDAVVSITLPVAEPGAAPQATSDAPAFDDARDRLAREYDPAADTDLRFTYAGNTLTIATDRGGRIEFYPHVSSAEFRDLYDAPEGDGGSVTLDIDPNRPGDLSAVRGILRTVPDRDAPDAPPRFLWIDRPLPPTIAG